MTIQISETNYGGFTAYSWTLKYCGKSFYLGQDVKFCSRVLGMRPGHVVDQIGDNDLRKETTRKKLAKFIVQQLGLNRSNVKNLQMWELSAE